MADRQRSFADMFPDVLGSMTRGAEWKEAMRPRTKKEMARQLTQEDRKWLKEREQQEWLNRRLNLLGPQDPAIAAQVLDYMMSIDPRRSVMKGFQKFILPKLSKMTRRRQKRQMKEVGETRPDPIPTSVEALEAHEQVSDRMGYNPTDREVGQHRSPSEHAMDLAGRFLQFLRDKDARAIDPSTVPDPDVNLDEYMRDVARRGQEASIRDEAGLPRRRMESDRFEQAEAARQLNQRVLRSAMRKQMIPDLMTPKGDMRLSGGSGYDSRLKSVQDLLGRTFGRRLSRD